MQLLHTALHFDQYLGILFAQYGVAVYAMLFAIIFVEIGFLPLFFLPGDPLLFFCGAFCVNSGMSLWIVMAVLFAATVAGSVVNYGIGRAVGQRVYTHNYRWLDKAALAKTYAFYEAHGGITFFLSPYLAVVRTFAPFVAGVSGMPFQRFLPFVTAGAALWVVTLVVGGYFFGNVPLVREHMGTIVMLGIGIGVGGLVLSSLWRLITATKRTLPPDNR